MVATPRYISEPLGHDVMFSVCSLVCDDSRYAKLLSSFEEFGFTPKNSEFIVADNRGANRFDGFNWQKRLFPECRGKYIIFCHEDIVLIDHGYDELVAALDALEALDPEWLVAGVAGGKWRAVGNQFERTVLRITDRYGADRQYGVLPARVETLDECFLVVKRERPVFASYDLEGFHFYGPDQCLMAELAGGSTYAIDFHLRHDGSGSKGQPFWTAKSAFTEKYKSIFPGRRLTCTTGPAPMPEGSWRDMS